MNLVSVLRSPSRHASYSGCFENMPPHQFWSLANEHSKLVTRMHTQVRLMGNFAHDGSLPWLKDTEGTLWFICKEDIENLDHFLLDCSKFKENFDCFRTEIIGSNTTDGIQIANFTKKLDRQHTVILLVGGLSLHGDLSEKSFKIA